MKTHPYLVPRSKMDGNREVGEAAQGFGPAADAWQLFHDKCREVVDSIDGPGLVLDMHGNVREGGH